MQYKQIAGHVAFAGDGTAYYHDMKENIDAKDAEFVVSYCINTVIQIESRVGNIDAPFGKDHWY